MKHGDAGLYAIAGAMIVSSGLMAICYSDMGRQPVPGQDAIGGGSSADGNPEGRCQTTSDAVDNKSVTVRVVIDDQSKVADAKTHSESNSAVSSATEENRSTTVSGTDLDNAVQKSRTSRDTSNLNPVRITDKNVRKASETQAGAIKELITKSLGRPAESIECNITISSWDGGDGSRLVISTCVDEEAFESGKLLSDAFGKLVADLVPVANKQFDDVEIISVMLYGMKGSAQLVEVPMYPKSKDISWAATASIDVPSREKGALGDINHVTVTYGGKPVGIDMTEHGFSSLPPEE